MTTWQCLKCGEPATVTVKATAGDNVPAEIEYKCPRCDAYAYWAYGSFEDDHCPFIPVDIIAPPRFQVEGAYSQFRRWLLQYKVRPTKVRVSKFDRNTLFADLSYLSTVTRVVPYDAVGKEPTIDGIRIEVVE